LSGQIVDVWIPLLNEGTVVSRPTKAEQVGAGLYRVLATPDYDPADEEWAYVPGSIVRCTVVTSEQGEAYLLATALEPPQ
jgi:hypothetical protein